MRIPLPLLLAVGCSLLEILPASAAVVWSDDFSTDTINGANPTRNFTGTAVGNDWSINPTNASTTFKVTTSVGNPAPSVQMLDTDSTTGSIVNKVAMTRMGSFSTATPLQSTLKISFDMNVTSFLLNGTNLASTPRFQLNSSISNNSVLFLGFGTTNASTGTDVFFAAGGAGTSPTSGNAFGGGTGAWNFGAYDSVTGTNNTSAGWIHFDITYVDMSTTATIVATEGANSTSLTLTGLTATSFSNLTANEGISFLSGSAGTEATYFDNILVQAVPEPSVVALAGFGGIVLLIGLRRRRASQAAA